MTRLLSKNPGHDGLTRWLPWVIFCVGSLGAMFGRSLWTPDEPRVAEIGRAMLESGDLVVPTLAEQPFLEKPPLDWWVMSASYRVFGVSPAAARLPSVLFALLTLLLVYDMARRIAGHRAGLLAAGVLLSVVNFHNMFRVVTDPALAFFVTLGFWAFQRGAFPKNKCPSRASWILLVHLSGGLAFLSKGIVALGLLYGPIVIYLLVARRWDLLLRPVNLLGALVLALLCAVWPFLLYQQGGKELLDGFLVDNVLNRFMNADTGSRHGGHKHPWSYYVMRAPAELLPWMLVIPSLYRSVLQDLRPVKKDKSELLFMASIFPVALLLLSIPGTKRTLYMLPIVPALAVAIGVWFVQSKDAPGRWSSTPRRLLEGLAILVATLLFIGSCLLLLSRAGVQIAPEISTIASGSAASGWLACLLALSSGGAAILLFRLWRSRRVADEAVVATWCGFWLIAQVCIFPLMEPAKDLRPFVQDLETLGAFEEPLVGFEFDETTLAALEYYGDYLVKEIQSPVQLEDWFSSNPQSKLLILERKQKNLPPSLAERLVIVQRWPLSGHRVYLLARFDPPTSPTSKDL